MRPVRGQVKGAICAPRNARSGSIPHAPCRCDRVAAIGQAGRSGGRGIRLIAPHRTYDPSLRSPGAYTVPCGGSTQFRLQLWKKNAGSETLGVPSGAVMPFHLAACPTGWSPLPSMAGRVIVGVGTLNSDVYALGDAGGAARVALSEAEMPAHAHKYPYQVEANIAGGTLTRATLTGSASTGASTTSAGGNAPHENRPPYLAFLYCQKD